MNTLKPSFSIIIPIYNEAENVDIVCEEILDALPTTQFNFEILFVDDGSTDDSRRRLKALTEKSNQIRYLLHKKNYGQSAALITGAKAAYYPLLVTLDGDGQNDPRDIPRLFAALQNNFTVILGNRKKRQDTFLRRLSSRIANSIRRQIFRDDCSDTGCSLKLFSRDGFLSLPHFNHLHRFLPALFKHAGYTLINVDVNHRPRKHGTSKYGIKNRLWIGIHDLIGVHWLLKRFCAPETETLPNE